MAGAGFRTSYQRGSFENAMTGVGDYMAVAATRALRTVSDRAKQAGRRSIASAGFSRKWQNALRADVYPKRGRASLGAAAVIRHKIPYAGVFERGATIHGAGLLWLPLPNAPAGRGGRRIKPSEYRAKIGWPLYSATIGGKAFLGAYVRLTPGRSLRSVSRAVLRRGRNPGGRGVVRFVPLYVGVTSVSISKKFDVTGAVDAAASDLAGEYAKEIVALVGV